MKLLMRDGRVFQGTPLQIVQAMHAIAFGVDQLALDRSIDWDVDTARRFEEVDLKVPEGSVEERAAVLVEEMVAKGLASR